MALFMSIRDCVTKFWGLWHDRRCCTTMRFQPRMVLYEVQQGFRNSATACIFGRSIKVTGRDPSRRGKTEKLQRDSLVRKTSCLDLSTGSRRLGVPHTSLALNTIISWAFTVSTSAFETRLMQIVLSQCRNRCSAPSLSIMTERRRTVGLCL